MNARTLSCERCGTSFGCDATGTTPCWCIRVCLTDARRTDLRARFGDCLCPGCLHATAAMSEKNEKAGAEKLRPA